MSLINRITPRDFADSYQTALSFLSNPYKLWVSDEYEHKKLVTKLVFAAPPQYQRKVGYRTAVTVYPFSVLSALESGSYELVDHRGNYWNQIYDVLADWHEVLKCTSLISDNSPSP